MKKRILCFACTVLMMMGMCTMGTAGNERLLSFRNMVIPSGTSAAVYESENLKSNEIGRLQADEQCEIIGASDAFFHVRFNGGTGYVSRQKAIVRTVRDSVPESICDTVSLLTATPGCHDENLLLQGYATADEPLESLHVYIWDERQQQTEYVCSKYLESPSARVDMSLFENAIPLGRFSGGRKTLVLEGNSTAGTTVLYRAPLYLYGDLQEPAHITGKCTDMPWTVTDDKYQTAWSPKKNQPSMTFRIPEGTGAALMTLEWRDLPDSLTVELKNADGQIIYKSEKDEVMYLESCPLDNSVREVTVTPVGSKAALGSVRIYDENYPRGDIQNWEPLPEKIDILLISTHQDDEFLFFGGCIPYYAAREDVTIGVAYMTDCGRSRYKEALDGLWSSGLHHYPIFLGLEDGYTMDVNKAWFMWQYQYPVRKLVRLIRQYKPEVIVGQDLNGEYGHGQHKYTAQLITKVLTLAEDAGYDPESAEEWGTWQIKKCYLHLYEENQIRMDWNVPLDETGIITPMFLAWEGFDKSKSQLAGFSMERDGVKYDNTLFGLYRTTVGPDVLKNDFMENVRVASEGATEAAD